MISAKEAAERVTIILTARAKEQLLEIEKLVLADTESVIPKRKVYYGELFESVKIRLEALEYKVSVNYDQRDGCCTTISY